MESLTDEIYDEAKKVVDEVQYWLKTYMYFSRAGLLLIAANLS